MKFCNRMRAVLPVQRFFVHICSSDLRDSPSLKGGARSRFLKMLLIHQT